MLETEKVVGGITGKVELTTGLLELECGLPCGQRGRGKPGEDASSLRVVRGGKVGTERR